MKRLRWLIALLLLIFAIVGFGLWRFMQADDNGHAAEVAADATVDAANATAAWVRDAYRDRAIHQVSVVNFMGAARGRGIDGPIVVVARLAVKGGIHLSKLCATLPRAHDAINMVLADRMDALLRRRAPLAADSFAGYAHALRQQLNREIAPGTVSDVTVIVRSARDVNQVGCTKAKPVQ